MMQKGMSLEQLIQHNKEEILQNKALLDLIERNIESRMNESLKKQK